MSSICEPFCYLPNALVNTFVFYQGLLLKSWTLTRTANFHSGIQRLFFISFENKRIYILSSVYII